MLFISFPLLRSSASLAGEETMLIAGVRRIDHAPVLETAENTHAVIYRRKAAVFAISFFFHISGLKRPGTVAAAGLENKT